MLKIPFYPNTQDNVHCYQATLKSVLKYYFPHKNYSYKYLDKVTAHKEGKYTWDNAMLLYLTRQNLEVVFVANYDYETFAKQGEEFLKQNWTEEVYITQRLYSDIEMEQKLASRLVESRSIKHIFRPAELMDIKNYFKRGYVILANVNSATLNDVKGYFPHRVLVTDINKKNITFHDPGLPGIKNRRVSIKKFTRAMQYPDKDSATLIAVKYPLKIGRQ